MTFKDRKFDVELERKVSPPALEWPTAQEADDESCLGCNRAYSDLRGYSWEEAKRIFDFEAELAERIRDAEDPGGEYAQIEEELYDDCDGGLFGLDIGVASTVICLSAANCIPFSSCSAGAFGGQHYENFPLVVFYARRECVELLLSCAEDAGIGLQDFEGYLMAYSNDIRSMQRFAHCLLRRSADFRNLQTSPTEV